MVTASSHISWDPLGYEIVSTLGGKISVSMQCLRASERGAVQKITKCLHMYPGLKSVLTNPYDVTSNSHVKLRPLRVHILELSRQQAVADMDAAQELEAVGDAMRAKRKRQRATRLLSRISSGRSGSIGAIRCKTGALATDAAAIAKILKHHWQDVFLARDIDDDKL